MFTLTNNTSLKRWKKIDSALCIPCKTNNQMQIHMLNNSSAALGSSR